MAKKKSRFSSLSTPGLKQDCSNYLVELVFLRSNKGTQLPPAFWQLQRYKWQYRNEIQACRKFIKKFGEPAVLFIAIHNQDIVTWKDFAKVEFLLQQIEESRLRRALPKDTSGIPKESVKVLTDLRDFTSPAPKKNLFERLSELSGKEEE
ncbi:hypothetical protein E4G67_00285 [Candidatus Bathyarchaeota archaeon]|nr:MAG: hypothetical protein E4G67_00285 [Candidatus Bathyarchaeota archaeon]